MSTFKFTTETDLPIELTLEFEATPLKAATFTEPGEGGIDPPHLIKLFGIEVPEPLATKLIDKFAETFNELCEEWLAEHIAEENMARAEAQYDFFWDSKPLPSSSERPHNPGRLGGLK